MFDGADALTLGALFIGAGAGLVVSVALRALLKMSGVTLQLWLIAVPAIALGLLFGPNIVDQMGGNDVRAEQIERDFQVEAARHPIMARVFADFPDLADDIRARAAGAYRGGGKAAFLDAMQVAGAEIQDLVLGFYLARASDTDIVLWLKTLPPIADALAHSSAALCRNWFLPDEGGATIHLRALAASSGKAQIARYEEALAQLFTRAGKTPFVADAGWGKVTLSALSQTLIADHGSETVEMLGRVRAPQTPEDDVRLCRAISDFYARLGALDESEAANAVRAALLQSAH